MEAPQIGELVTFVDQRGRARPALVTANHEPHRHDGSINVVFVSDDETRHDDYGRQTERETSVVHKGNQGAPGFYWLHGQVELVT